MQKLNVLEKVINKVVVINTVHMSPFQMFLFELSGDTGMEMICLYRDRQDNWTGNPRTEE